MKNISCEITGIAPLLQHRFAEEKNGANKSRAKKKVYDPEEEAETALFRGKDGNIYHPSEHIFGAMVKSAVYFKFEGKKTYKDIIKRGVIVEPFEIPLMDEKGEVYKGWDEIDTRRVVIQRSAITRWRPLFHEGWKLKFNISIIDDENLAPSTLKEILERAGTIGIGDYRPRFGRFQVTSFKENGISE